MTERDAEIHEKTRGKPRRQAGNPQAFAGLRLRRMPRRRQILLDGSRPQKRASLPRPQGFRNRPA